MADTTTIRLPPKLRARIHALAKQSGRSAHPLVGRRVHGDIRDLVVSYGQTGYIALYRYLAPRDEIRVLAIRHQREIEFVP